MKGLCECGCGQKTNIAPQTDPVKGWVKGEPLRFVFGHYKSKPKTPRFAVIDCGYETPCWVWLLLRDTNGYGQHHLGPNRRRPAHAVHYEEKYGPVPEGLELDHLCRVRSCVNPDHLEPVTHRENTLRGVGPSAQNARKTHCVRGHALEGANAHIRPNGKRECLACRDLRNAQRCRWRLEAA